MAARKQEPQAPESIVVASAASVAEPEPAPGVFEDAPDKPDPSTVAQVQIVE